MPAKKNIEKNDWEGIEKSIMTQKQMKDYLGIGYDTLNDWKKMGLPAYRVNSRVYYMLEDVKNFMKKFEV